MEENMSEDCVEEYVHSIFFSTQDLAKKKRQIYRLTRKKKQFKKKIAA